MKLETEIKQQKPFHSETERLTVNILFTAAWLQTFYKDFFKQFDISAQQYNILRILRGQHPNPATINLLKERMLDKMPDVSRLVDRLLIKGFITRITCPKDRRAVDIVIAEKGIALLKSIEEKMPQAQVSMNTLSEEEKQQLNTLLDKLRG
ncbi:MAG: MarR family transcriptional regulator [Bacteroidota bacterium]